MDPVARYNTYNVAVFLLCTVIKIDLKQTTLFLISCFPQVYFCQTKDRLQNYAVKQVDLGVNGRETQQVKRLKILWKGN